MDARVPREWRSGAINPILAAWELALTPTGRNPMRTLESIGRPEPYQESEKQRKRYLEALTRLVDGIIIRSWVEYDKATNWPRIERGEK